MMRIAVAQTPNRLGDKEENLRRMQTCVAKKEADIYVFGEMFLTGYMCRDLIPKLAEDVDGRSIKRVQALAQEHECYVVFGMPLWSKEVPGLLHNCCVCIGPEGEVQTYEKLNLANFGPFEERFYFTPGQQPVMFDILGSRFGVCICYDIFFPELIKSYALQGAKGLICISASPITSREQFERVLPARAAENTMYVLYSNLVGTQLNMVFFGGGQAYSPKGERLVKNDYLKEDIRVVEFDPKEIAIARHMRPTIRDTLGGGI
ncbi:MAG: carbon-nitrogen hydrolase family protein [Methanomassiliicoccales archaeon]